MTATNLRLRTLALASSQTKYTSLLCEKHQSPGVHSPTGFPPRAFRGSHSSVLGSSSPWFASFASSKLLFASTLAFALTLALPAKADLTSWLALGGGMALEHTRVTSPTNGAGAFGRQPRGRHDAARGHRRRRHLPDRRRLRPRHGHQPRPADRDGRLRARRLGLRRRRRRRLPLLARTATTAPSPCKPSSRSARHGAFGLGLGVNAIDLSGSPGALGGFALLEIDLLRLTLMRQGLD